MADDDTYEATTSLMSDQAREAVIAELDFIEKLQAIVTEKLRAVRETWREDRYLSDDLDDCIAEARRLRKEITEIELGLKGDRYHY